MFGWLLGVEDRSLENPALSLHDPTLWEEVFGSYRSATGESVTATKALSYAPFWHAVQMIAGDVARLPKHVNRRRPDLGDEARERDRGHRLNPLLNLAANEQTEALKFWQRLVADTLVWRNGYARILRAGLGGPPLELVNLLPDRTTREWVEGRLLYFTEIGIEERRVVALLPEDVIHLQGLAVRGIEQETLFQLARNSIGLGLAQENFAAKFFKHGGRVGGILELPAALKKEARDKLEEGFRKTYEGSENPFKTIVLRDNAKFHAAQTSPRDSQLVEATDAQTRQIAHWFNLAPSKLGLSDSVSYNSKAEDNQSYLDNTLAIWLARIEASCNWRLLSEAEQATHFIEHNTAALLRLDLATRYTAYQTAVGRPFMTPNEARARENMLPLAGGDELASASPGAAGNPPADPPADPAEPARGIRYLRTLLAITARARDKAKRPAAFLEWIDGNLAPFRQAWGAASAFPFEDLLGELRKLAETTAAADLPAAVDQLCQRCEECL